MRMKMKICVIALSSIGLLACSSSSRYGLEDIPRNEAAAGYNIELGLGYLEQGNVERAKAKLLRAVKQDPKSADTHMALAYYFEEAGEFEAAEQSYKKSISLDSKAGNPLNSYGAFLCRIGRYEEAEKLFLRAIKDPHYVAVGKTYENLGLCALESEDVAEQKRYFELALNHDPNLYNSLIELAAIEYEEGHYERAQSYLLRYREIALPTPQSLLLGVQIADVLGDTDQRDSYALLLRHNYPESAEFVQLTEFN